MTKIICSHGFGVDATDRGLFTDIAAAFPDREFTMFDYNELDAGGNMTVRPLPEQVQVLNQYIQEAGEEVVLLCHSLGCVVAAMADLAHVSKLVFLAPPDNLDLQRFVGIFGKREGTVFNPEGMSSIPRRDGTKTLIGKEFLQSIQLVNVPDIFHKATEECETTIIRADQDEVVGQTDFSGIGRARIISLPGSHNFVAEARQQLIVTLKELLH